MNATLRGAAAIACTLGMLAAPVARAIGLGEAEIGSRLNEPLALRIPVSGLRAGELDELRVRIADEAAFRRAGLDRAALPPGLRLEILARAGRGPFIEVRTRQAVREPHVAFVLELESRAGVVQRAYALLLDYR